MKRYVKVGELNFELTTSNQEGVRPTLEVENDASILFHKLELEEAIELKDLLEDFISGREEFRPSEEDGPVHEFYSA